MTIHHKINYKAHLKSPKIAKAMKTGYAKIECGIFHMPKEPVRNLKEPKGEQDYNGWNQAEENERVYNYQKLK